MSAAEAYKKWLKSQGEERLADDAERFPRNIWALDKELPEASNHLVFQHTGRIGYHTLVFQLPNQERVFYETFIANDFGAQGRHPYTVRVHLTLPDPGTAWIPEWIIGRKSHDRLTIQSFAELRNYVPNSKKEPVDAGLSCHVL
jgi:hypothetical protein